MEDRLPLLRALPLFCDMADGEILRALACFHAREKRFDRARIAWDFGKQSLLGLILQGGMTLRQEDLRGNSSVLGSFGPGDHLDGETLSKAGSAPFFLCVQAGTSVLLLERKAVMNPCAINCRAHLLLLRNAMQAMAQRELELLYKIDCLSKRTTREKILAYLNLQAALQGARQFNLPYTRQELADLLAVDRSAMCTELTHMQNDGLIRFERKRFELLL